MDSGHLPFPQPIHASRPIEPSLDPQGISRQDTGPSDADRRNNYLVSIGVIIFVGIFGIAVRMLDKGGPVIPYSPPSNPSNPVMQSTKNWFVTLGSFSKPNRPLAEKQIRKLQTSGYQVSLIDTNQYANLKYGLWAVVLGPYVSKELVNSEKKKVLKIVPDAYVKLGK